MWRRDGAVVHHVRSVAFAPGQRSRSTRRMVGRRHLRALSRWSQRGSGSRSGSGLSGQGGGRERGTGAQATRPCGGARRVLTYGSRNRIARGVPSRVAQGEIACKPGLWWHRMAVSWGARVTDYTPGHKSPNARRMSRHITCSGTLTAINPRDLSDKPPPRQSRPDGIDNLSLGGCRIGVPRTR